MATHDHTGRARPSSRKSPTDPLSHNGPVFPLSRADARRQTYVSKLVSTALAGQVIHDVLDRYNGGVANQRSRCGCHALTPMQANGLRAALYFLREYVQLLKPEPGG